MYVIPYHSFEVSVQGTIPEVEQFLADFVQPRRRWWQRDRNYEAEFDGVADEQGFRIRIPFLEAPPLGIVVRGRFNQTGPGVVVSITIRPNALTLLMLGVVWIYCIVSAWAFSANLIGGLAIPSKLTANGFGYFIGLAIFHGMILLHFNDAARPAKKRLIELFEDMAMHLS